MNPHSRVCLVLALILLSACAGINRSKSDFYAARAAADLQQGTWATAQADYGRALILARQSGAGKNHLAALHYQFGRTSGVICEYRLAYGHLLRAQQLDEQTGGPVHMDLTELAWLHLDKGDYTRAAHYFDLALPLYIELNLDARDPIGLADALIEYALALEKTGRAEQARKAKGKALALMRAHPQTASQTERTPYYTECSNESEPK